ncbi:MAG TPA: ABC transporter permease [Bryobacteraceae bacterium]|nr:ABC transporter permease [Bryobacteraceae bacterium]
MAIFERLWNLFRPRTLARDLEDELRHHVALRAADLERFGLPAGEARRQAALALGNATLEKERMRDMDVAAWLESFLKDVHYALRQLRRNPGFTVVAVVSLALGIGANTTIFSVLNAALLKSLPVPHPEELVMLTDPESSGTSIGNMGGDRTLLTYAEYAALRDHMITVSSLCATESQLDHLFVRVAGGPQEEVFGRLVTENYFVLFGVSSAVGRVFTEADGTAVGADPYAVISYDYWQRRFAGSPSVIGTQIRLNGATLTVIGVASRGFHGEAIGRTPDIWMPMEMQPLVMPGRDYLHEDLSASLDKVMWLQVFGRRKPGVSLAAVQAEANVLFKRDLEAAYPRALPPERRRELLDQRLVAINANTGAFSGRKGISSQLLILLAVAGLVLLIACANVANLLLARAAARHKEVGVRLSIGAGKGRLVRQFFTESLLLSFLGGAVGVLFAAGASEVLVRLLSTRRSPMALATSLDTPVLAFTIGITLLTGLLFGLAPALRLSRIDISESLKESGRGLANSGRALRMTKALVITQVALSLLLVAGAGLFLRTLWNLQSAPVGYVRDQLLQVSIDGLTAGYKGTRIVSLYHDLTGRLGSLPGVRSVTYSRNGLFTNTDSGDDVQVEGYAPRNEEDNGAAFDRIGAAYFSTLGIPIILGREIERSDVAGSQLVCVINEAFAKHFFAGRNPIGRTVFVGPDKKTPVTVVGVAKDVHDHQVRGDVDPRFYVSLEQGVEGVSPGVYFEIRASGDPARLSNAARKTILDVNGDIPVNTLTVRQTMDNGNAQPRMLARLCSIFGILALVLAAVGLYGVLSYSVARRTNEIGIRMALGAAKSGIVAMILRETGSMLAGGVVAGALAVAAFGRLVTAWLYGLTALDPLTIFAAVAALCLVALVAGCIPALRAARVNPVMALRRE